MPSLLTIETSSLQPQLLLLYVCVRGRERVEEGGLLEGVVLVRVEKAALLVEGSLF